MKRLRVYLAGPDVFLADAEAVAAKKRDLCFRYGFIGVSPVDNELDLCGAQGRAAAMRIFAANEDMIRGCDLLIANITPFRGPSADVGTAYEMGFARGLGRPVFAYTNVASTLLERTRTALAEFILKRGSDEAEDDNQMAIENFGCEDNLMLVGGASASGTPLVVAATSLEGRFTDLAGFEKCLAKAAEQLPGH
jgi:nucleoside 2-deoxyribosyltransferase